MILGDPLYLALLLPCILLMALLPGGLPRSLFALACSYAYYLTFPVAFFPVLLGITAITYLGGLAIERADQTGYKRWVVAGTIVLCMAPLAIYKYLVPILSATPGGTSANWQLTTAQLLAPVGLSFFSFAAVGYLADVALGLLPAERKPLRLALFCGFFPYVTSGPIPRATHLLPQLDFKRDFTAESGMRGVTEILTGVAMKLWIADSLGLASSSVFSNLAQSAPIEKLMASMFFAFQLYADFAGYSLIAIGSARLFGIQLADNFRQPYLANSIVEFWRRWHISLFTWLRDYVFTPLRLQWRKRPQLGTSIATFITLVLVGVWHGAGWGFVAFGVVHGLLMVGSQLTLAKRDRFWTRVGVPATLVNYARVPVTFLIVTLTFVLVRARDVPEALSIYKSLFTFKLFKGLSTFVSANEVNLALIGVLLLGDLLVRSKKFTFFQLPMPARAGFYAVCVLTVLYQVISSNVTKPFVYFQF